jgi:hypothetical protein
MISGSIHAPYGRDVEVVLVYSRPYFKDRQRLAKCAVALLFNSLLLLLLHAALHYTAPPCY